MFGISKLKLKALLLYVAVPPIVRPQKNTSILIYANLNLTCIVEGDPFPTVHWIKRNNALSISRAQLSADNRTLLIKDVDVAVEGVYTCVAVNRAGNHSSSVTVEVLSRCLLTRGFTRTIIFCQLQGSSLKEMSLSQIVVGVFWSISMQQLPSLCTRHYKTDLIE